MSATKKIKRFESLNEARQKVREVMNDIVCECPDKITTTKIYREECCEVFALQQEGFLPVIVRASYSSYVTKKKQRTKWKATVEIMV